MRLMNTLDRFFADLGHALPRNVLVEAALEFGPFAGEEMLTVFFLDGEGDPAYAQFASDDGWYVFGPDSQTHVAIPLHVMTLLCGLEHEVTRLWDLKALGYSEN